LREVARKPGGGEGEGGKVRSYERKVEGEMGGVVRVGSVGGAEGTW